MPFREVRGLISGSCESATEYRAWKRRCRRSAAIDTAAASGRRSPKLARVEAALIVADGALSARRLAQSASLLDSGEARQLVDELNAAYDACGSAFRVERVGSGFQMLTLPAYARWLDKIHQRQERLKLSASSLETLTIIAYRQPITRADIEAVRGVQSSEVLKQLMERGLVKVVGEDDSLGRPYLYGTTRAFLESYGLRNLNDLPDAGLLRVNREPVAAAAEESESAADSEESGEAA
jgi:segregation and condensation protein B